MNTQEETIPSGNCTPGRPEQLRSVFSCHSLGFLLSILCRTMLSCFCLGLLLPCLHLHGWTRRVRVRIRLRPCLLQVRIVDRIKNRGPYRCLSLTRVFLASKTSLSIADHLQATFIYRSTCQAYIETLKMPLTHKQAKKWWTNRQTNKQTNQTLYPCRRFPWNQARKSAQPSSPTHFYLTTYDVIFEGNHWEIKEKSGNLVRQNCSLPTPRLQLWWVRWCLCCGQIWLPHFL